MARKRLTRKDIRQPDQFVTLLSQLLDQLQRSKVAILASLVVLVALGLAFWGFQIYKQRQNREAGQIYSQAVALYHTGKYREALEALERLNPFRWAKFRSLGLIYKANTHLALGEPEKAAAAARSFLEYAGSDPLLRQVGVLTMAHAQEKAGQCKEAAQSYSEAEKLPGPFKEDGLLGKARCALESGDLKIALESYRKYLNDYPFSERLPEISTKIREIEAKQQSSKKEG